MVSIALVFLGLALGSFVNVSVQRRRYNSQVEDDADVSPQFICGTRQKASRLSILRGRSFCMHCNKQLKVVDLIPILSWLWLRGKCRYCHEKYPDNPLPEVLTPLLFLFTYYFWPYQLVSLFDYLVFAIWLAIIVLFVIMIIHDFKWMKLPHPLTAATFLLGLVFLAARYAQEQDTVIIISGLMGSVVVGGLFHALFVVSQSRWIGWGDVRLGYGIGLIAGGPIAGFILLFLSSLIGLAAALPGVLNTNKSFHQLKIPFGPPLMLATILTVLLSETIVDFYINLVLFG